MRFQVLGVDRTINNLMKYAQEIKESLNRDINLIGEEVLFRLKEIFDSEIISGQMTGLYEYTIIMKDIIICVVSGRRVLTEREKIVGRDWSNMVNVDYDFLIQDYLQQALFRIKNSLNIILK